MPKNFFHFLLTAAAIAAAIILVELVKSKAISAFWKTMGAA